ncbi:MAG TPA: hypothetical protein VGF26_22165, partial [Ramlibacter sp.]
METDGMDRGVCAAHGHIRGRIRPLHERGAIIVYRFLDEQDRIMLRKARQQVLRPLKYEIPAQVAKNDDSSHDGSSVGASQTC